MPGSKSTPFFVLPSFMDALPRWLRRAILGILWLGVGLGLLFLAACLFWYLAWTNTGTLNDERMREQESEHIDTARFRPPGPGQTVANPTTDSVARAAR